MPRAWGSNSQLPGERIRRRVAVPLVYRGADTGVAYWLDFLVEDQVIWS